MNMRRTSAQQHGACCCRSSSSDQHHHCKFRLKILQGMIPSGSKSSEEFQLKRKIVRYEIEKNYLLIFVISDIDLR